MLLKDKLAMKSAVVNSKPALPAFTDSISILIEVESIHQKLLAELPEDYKHRETLAHAIIGSCPNLSYIFIALNGYSNSVDFEVGDRVVCVAKGRTEQYDANLEDLDGRRKMLEQDVPSGNYKANWRQRELEIGECKVVDINLYSEDKLKVEWIASDGTKGHQWVSHKKCTKWADGIE